MDVRKIRHDGHPIETELRAALVIVGGEMGVGLIQGESAVFVASPDCARELGRDLIAQADWISDRLRDDG